MSQDAKYPRDMVGYGATPPNPKWPDNARIAVQFVVNYEEGGENNILHGDEASEAFLSEIVGAAPWPGERHLNMESIYEYGSRAGVWRLARVFESRGLHFTVFTVGMALERHPDAVRELKAAGHEIASHGYRWIDYRQVDEEVERDHIAKAVAAHEKYLGERPLGFYQGRTGPNSRKLCIEEGGFFYDADSYADDLPYWNYEYGRPHLIVPYTLDANDMRFATPQGFNAGDQFFNYLKDSFDVLYEEGADQPKMMSVGLHCRLSGRPGRAAAVARFLDYIQSKPQVWVARRIDIAQHWAKTHPPSST
ncbi:MAG: allantoinase PuuE [Myxococcota bacterium]|nr:allantoinase PuuE [Myxococcota bacterium]